MEELKRQEGGIVLVKDGQVLASMPMPIAGLMSDQSGEWVDEKLKELVSLPVSHIATERVVSILADATLQDACTLLAQHKLKKVPVMSHGAIVGMLSRSDVIRYAMDKALAGIGE